MDVCASIALGSAQTKKMMQPSLTDDELLVAFDAIRDYREKSVALLQKGPTMSLSTMGILEELVDLSQSIRRECHERVSSCISVCVQLVTDFIELPYQRI